MIKYQHLVTNRLEQLTGDEDPEGKLHVNKTSEFGCLGTDLGANTIHDDATFIYFGDTICKEQSPQELNQTDLIAFIDHFKLIPGSYIATTHQVNDNMLNVFYVDEHGRMYTSFVSETHNWKGPIRITKKNKALPGSPLATAHQVHRNITNVFYTGINGGLYVTWVTGYGSWQKNPYLICSTDYILEGSHIEADHQDNDHVLNVFFIGKNGRLYVTWVVGSGSWNTPFALTSESFSKAGTPIVTSHQVNDHVLNVFFTGSKGGLFTTWVVGGGRWNKEPFRLVSNDLIESGAHLATAHQGDRNILNVFFIGKDGALYVIWVEGGGTWNKPFPLTPQNTSKPGSYITSFKQNEKNLLYVFFTGSKGGLYHISVQGGNKWNKNQNLIVPVDKLHSGSYFAVDFQVNEHQIDALYVDTAKELHITWRNNVVTWQIPTSISNGFRLTPIMNGPNFQPFKYSYYTIDSNSNPIDQYIINNIILNKKPEKKESTLPRDSTPSGAFSYNNNLFVFFYHQLEIGKDYYKGFSALAYTNDPFSGQAYELLFEISNQTSKKRFFQIAPSVINNKEISGLPSKEGDGIIMFTYNNGYHGNEPIYGVSLLWMPLYNHRLPTKCDLHYYNKESKIWSKEESNSSFLFTTTLAQFWSAISVGRVPELGYWIFLYQECGGIQYEYKMDEKGNFVLDEKGNKIFKYIKDENGKEKKIINFNHCTYNLPIHARIGINPWDIGDNSNIEIFNPKREKAIGKYIFREENPIHPGFAYGPYILNNYSRWDKNSSILTITYLMSSGNRYQVQVMKTSIQIYHPLIYTFMDFLSRLVKKIIGLFKLKSS